MGLFLAEGRLGACVEELTRRWSGAAPERPFVPHVTVARPRRRGSGRARTPAAFRVLAIERDWDPPAIELLASRRDPAGGPPRYEPVAAWPWA